MNVVLISQCDKRALAETRRILDQFAERRGDRTWQSAITRDGLETLHRLLRKTARKNTAVICHWVRGLDHTEVLWIVGDRRRFNPQGAVPTKTTQRDVLRQADENDWHSGQVIRLLAQLAALLHDLGKASVAFQRRLRGELSERNLYRHEWVSLRLFQAFVGDDDDAGWLRRLAERAPADELPWLAPGRYLRDGLDRGISQAPFSVLPPLAAAVAWLVVTHHRLPVVPGSAAPDTGRSRWGQRVREFKPIWISDPMVGVTHAWNEPCPQAAEEDVLPYWEPAGPLPVTGPKWRAQASRIAAKLEALRMLQPQGWLDDAYVMHLARLCLMLADHHYSSLDRLSPLRVEGDGSSKLYANTDARGLKQPLEEHLLGVAHEAGLIAHALPSFARELPAIAQHKGLRKRSGQARFAWQDKAVEAAAGMRTGAHERGAFIVNMASTGCGKTLANARMLYALADPERGLRATYALGLRTLTLQTGRSYRGDLHLGDDDLAVLVGGSASRELFEFYEQQEAACGSASAQKLIEEDSHVVYEGDVSRHPLLSRALADPDVHKLLTAPLLVCTVDHIAPATEALRGGRQIAPMLRLLSGDLILDELDDYDLADLPAITRLVQWAGLLGSRLVLSSATLPPTLVEGMFMAYRSGRVAYQRNRGPGGGQGAESLAVPCLWVDEFGVSHGDASDAKTFRLSHGGFVERRAQRLAKAAVIRRASLQALVLDPRSQRQERHASFAEDILGACLQLHRDHAEVDPRSRRRVSFGLVRMANVDPLIEVAQALFRLGAPEGMRVHLCVYHARFPQVLRSAIEHLLDSVFDRRRSEEVYGRHAVRTLLDGHSEADHVFVVLASPVCEVGRDWDVDWAVVEPSSMRSLIQLAGRVQRHRGKPCSLPNLRVFDTNLRHFANGNRKAPVYIRPGFETLNSQGRWALRLETPWLHDLLQPATLLAIHAVPRIRPLPRADWNPTRRWIDLEHERVLRTMLPRNQALPTEAEELNASACWQARRAHLSGVLPQQQPFREDTLASETLVFLPDEEGEALSLHRLELQRQPGKRLSLYTPSDDGRCHPVQLAVGPRIGPWVDFDLLGLLAEQAEHFDLPLRRCAERMATVRVRRSDQGWRWHPWLGFGTMA
ncbi:type I-F CRISPR-associated helicase Cas3f [Piscinibacter sakaiensis]|uniref:CRISPR-associated protein, YPO2467 family n=1 Tax=Piscinibacter sakaiensis TaxID=1547922 RepID=A0A0K8P585_PISS1|nr:type I-F CRISPR-associated helicase Cas3f [Piscinibacter sakaiensis]GAP37736.1 CRISPR-associated protein, YPO2467 family [Piscinibacter sakaiensis]